MKNATDFYINGKWVRPTNPHDFSVENPSNEEIFAKISLGSQADVDNAVRAAREAFPIWSGLAIEERIAYVERLLDVYKSRIGEMAEAIHLEMGAPMKLAQESQAMAGLGHLKIAIRSAQNFEFEHALNDRAPDTIIRYEPIGVVGMITPWNWPMNQVVLKVAPALLAGCTMVLKPSEIAPLSSYLLAEFIDEADFPAGVFNLVNGDGEGVGNAMSSHRDIDMISFTGSTRAGRAISIAAAETIKRVSLELGGKGANIIFEAARDSAVKDGVFSCFSNSGQSCNAPTRMLVHRSRYDEALEQAKEAAQSVIVGHSEIGNGINIGPVVSHTQFDKIQTLIQSGIDEGAHLLIGGVGRPEHLNKGWFVKPTIFADVSPEMTIWREEIFGPVLSITPFDSEGEAISLANDTVYGLTNYIQSEDENQARRVAYQLRSGMVEINGKHRAAGSPFGGMKQSGNGREGGEWGLHEFLEVKAISGW